MSRFHPTNSSRVTMRCPECEAIMEKQWHAEHFAVAPVLIWKCLACQEMKIVEEFKYERRHAYDV